MTPKIDLPKDTDELGSFHELGAFVSLEKDSDGVFYFVSYLYGCATVLAKIDSKNGEYLIDENL